MDDSYARLCETMIDYYKEKGVSEDDLMDDARLSMQLQIAKNLILDELPKQT